MSRRWACAVAGAVLMCVLAPPALADTTAPPEVVELGGVAVDPSTDRARPTPLGAGIWSDTLGPGDSPEDTHYFSYERTMEDSTVHIGVAGANTVANDYVSVVVTTPQDDPCGSDESTSGSTNTFGTFGAGVAAGPADAEDRDDPCLRSGELRIAVGRGSATTTTDLPVVIRIVEEAPPTGVTELPTPPPTPRVEAPDGAASGESSGATSFEDAPYLDPGSYQTNVTEGEERLWRVRLDWGQQLSVRLDVPAASEAAIGEVDFLSSEVELVMVDPLLNSFRDGVEGAESSGSYGETASRLVDGSPPVGYRNRFDDVAATLPGDYWVTVSVNSADDHAPLVVPMVLELDVIDTGRGRPSFPDTVRGVGGSAGPEGYDRTTPYLVGDGEFSADVSGTPRVPADDESDGPDTRTLAGLALAVVSAGLCVAGAVSLRRRSRA